MRRLVRMGFPGEAGTRDLRERMTQEMDARRGAHPDGPLLQEDEKDGQDEAGEGGQVS